MRLGALEAGGTKMVCAIGNANGEIYERISIPTETPEITVPKMIEYFKEKDIQALGIGCFGPIDLKIRNIWLHYHNSQISMEELQHRRRFRRCTGHPGWI